MNATVERNEKPAVVGPRLLLAGAAALLAFAFVATGAARMTDVGTVHMPVAAPVETLLLRFVDDGDGGVGIIDAKDGARIFTVAPGTNGFIRATMRGLTRERLREDVGEAPPFRLTHWSDGTLSLEDVTIGRRVNLDAFGPTNAEAFAQLFAARSRVR
jgi:putative photosynthetic complex assembly protein